MFLIDILTYIIFLVVLPVMWIKNQIGSQVSVEVGESTANGGKPRRSPGTEKALITQPHPEVKTLYDVVQHGLRTYPASAPLFGSREVKRIVEEEKIVTKSVGGVETTEKKVWKYFELSGYSWLTYREAAAIMAQLGAGLRQLGLNAGDKVMLYASTGRDWMLMAHGCFTQNLVITTAYDTLGEEGLTFSLNECVNSIIFTQADLLPMLSKVAAKTPALKTVVYTGKATPEQVNAFQSSHPQLKLLTLDELRALGQEKPAEPTLPAADDLCCIMYTSGSTGNPKGVMISHANVVTAIAATTQVIKHKLDGNDSYLAYLPLAHILEFMIEQMCIFNGIALGYGGVRTLSDTSVRNCKGDIRELRPTMMAGVPTVWETIRKGVAVKMESMSSLKKAVFGLASTLKWNLLQMGLPTGFIDNAVFKPIQDNTGGRLKAIVSGGAPMAPDTQKFMTVCVAPVLQGYGLTETCGTLAFQNFGDVGKVGCVGGPAGNVELKLVAVENTDYTPFPKDSWTPPRGEVWARGGPIMKGYFKQDKLTQENFSDDGWFMTGDIGEWRADGSLAIIDRKKNLVKLAHGEYVALEKLESQYKTSSVVANICVHADPLETYVVAVIVPIEREIRSIASKLDVVPAGVADPELAELCKNPKVHAKVLENLKAVAKAADFKPAEILGAVYLVHEEWTPENGLLTAAQKLKRADIVKRYAADIKTMYKKK